MLPAGPDVGDPQRPAVVGGGDDLDVATVVPDFSGPPQVHAAGRARDGDPVGLDHRAVDDHVLVAGGLGREQRVAQVGGLPGQHRDALVQAAVADRLADLVVVAQLFDPCPIAEPAQDEHGLFPGGELTGPLPGTFPLAFRDQQYRQAHDSVIAKGQLGGVCDTHRDVGPLGSRSVGRQLPTGAPRFVFHRPDPTAGTLHSQ